ncbi:MAG TPA: class I SAM-dependent methyltransferase [Polyangiales bacterium]|jgi:SAM-dependent methyltransferase|nr:class I SAM-dependent methyltransferase [Polyangiales bacterium]
MNRATQLALNRVNQRFYAQIAEQWPHKRKHPWPGFQRIHALRLAAHSGNESALDLGCGDGRFAQFLADQHAQCSYLGIDNSPALLDLAAQRALPASFRFEHADFVEEPLAQLLRGSQFQLIVLLGVLHHIPGSAQRKELVRELAKHLAPAGHFIFTVWRLDEDPRFSSRCVPFDTYNENADEPLDLEQLESGDTLLRWDDAKAPRYCHFPDLAELSQLIAATGLVELERYRADGHLNRMNEYVVLRPL